MSITISPTSMMVTATARISEPNGSPTLCATTSAWCTAATIPPTSALATTASTAQLSCSNHAPTSTSSATTGTVTGHCRRSTTARASMGVNLASSGPEEVVVGVRRRPHVPGGKAQHVTAVDVLDARQLMGAVVLCRPHGGRRARPLAVEVPAEHGRRHLGGSHQDAFQLGALAVVHAPLLARSTGGQVRGAHGGRPGRGGAEPPPLLRTGLGGERLAVPRADGVLAEHGEPEHASAARVHARQGRAGDPHGGEAHVVAGATGQIHDVPAAGLVERDGLRVLVGDLP